MIELSYNHVRNLIELLKVTNPSELVDFAFDFYCQLIAVAVEISAPAVYFTIQLVRRFEDELSSDFSLQVCSMMLLTCESQRC